LSCLETKEGETRKIRASRKFGERRMRLLASKRNRGKPRVESLLGERKEVRAEGAVDRRAKSVCEPLAEEREMLLAKAIRAGRRNRGESEEGTGRVRDCR